MTRAKFQWVEFEYYHYNLFSLTTSAELLVTLKMDFITVVTVVFSRINAIVNEENVAYLLEKLIKRFCYMLQNYSSIITDY